MEWKSVGRGGTGGGGGDAFCFCSEAGGDEGRGGIGGGLRRRFETMVLSKTNVVRTESLPMQSSCVLRTVDGVSNRFTGKVAQLRN